MLNFQWKCAKFGSVICWDKFLMLNMETFLRSVGEEFGAIFLLVTTLMGEVCPEKSTVFLV